MPRDGQKKKKKKKKKKGFAPCGEYFVAARFLRRKWRVAESLRQISRLKTSTQKRDLQFAPLLVNTHRHYFAVRRSAPLSPPSPAAPPPRRYMDTQLNGQTSARLATRLASDSHADINKTSGQCASSARLLTQLAGDMRHRADGD